jgi:hypothetical protein
MIWVIGNVSAEHARDCIGVGYPTVGIQLKPAFCGTPHLEDELQRIFPAVFAEMPRENEF